jgi:AbiV family abortive infection protein
MISVKDQQVGIRQCELNAHSTIIESNNLFNEGYFRHSAFFSIIALEEIGKAFFLLDSYEKGKPLSQKEWENWDTFFGHLQKMKKATDEFISKTKQEIHELFPGIPRKVAVLGFSQQDICNLWKLRNRLLFVDYNFDENKWDHPQQLSNFKDDSYECLNKALSTFGTLEDILHEKGFDTLKLFK